MRQILTFIASLALAASAASCAAPERSAAERAAETLSIVSTTGEAHRFTVEVADNDDERRIGLMYRTALAPDAGMLFDFKEIRPVSMWMKNTLIPLDMAFIEADGRIARIAVNTTPQSLESIPSGRPVLAVLEVNAGTFERLGVKAGDTVRHEVFRNK